MPAQILRPQRQLIRFLRRHPDRTLLPQVFLAAAAKGFSGPAYPEDMEYPVRILRVLPPERWIRCDFLHQPGKQLHLNRDTRFLQHLPCNRLLHSLIEVLAAARQVIIGLSVRRSALV